MVTDNLIRSQLGSSRLMNSVHIHESDRIVQGLQDNVVYLEKLRTKNTVEDKNQLMIGAIVAGVLTLGADHRERFWSYLQRSEAVHFIFAFGINLETPDRVELKSIIKIKLRDEFKRDYFPLDGTWHSCLSVLSLTLPI